VFCSSTESDSSKSDRRGDPLELERLQVGSVYGIGSHFKSDGLEFSVVGFGEGLGNTEISMADAGLHAKKPKDAAKTLHVSHAMLRCQGRHSSLLEFDFVDSGGAVALEFGGEKRSAANFIDLDGAQLGTSKISVRESSTAGVRSGRVSVSGAIDKFAIAGADLEIVDLRLSR
jgi:hypothetical protein